MGVQPQRYTRERRNGIVDAHMNLQTQRRRYCCCVLDSVDGEEFDFYPIAFLVYIGWMAVLSILVICAEVWQDSTFEFEFKLDPGHHSMDDSHAIGVNEHFIDYVLIYGVMVSSLAESFFSYYRFYTTMMVSRLLVNISTTAVCKRFSLYMALFCVLYVCAMHLFYFVFPLILVLFIVFNVFCVVKFSLDLLQRLRPLVDTQDSTVVLSGPNEDLYRSVLFMRNISLICCLLRCICLAFFLITYNVDAIYLLPMLWAISVLLFAMNFIRNRRCVQHLKIQWQQRCCTGNRVVPVSKLPPSSSKPKHRHQPPPTEQARVQEQKQQQQQQQYAEEEQQDEMPSMNASMFKKRRSNPPLSKADTLSQRPFELEVIHPQNSLTEEKSYAGDSGDVHHDSDDNKSEPAPQTPHLMVKQQPPVLIQRSAPLYWTSNGHDNTNELNLKRPASMDAELPGRISHQTSTASTSLWHTNSGNSSRSTTPRAPYRGVVVTPHNSSPALIQTPVKIRVPEKPKALLLLGIDTPVSYGTPSFPTPNSLCLEPQASEPRLFPRPIYEESPEASPALGAAVANFTRADTKSNTLSVPSPTSPMQKRSSPAQPVVQALRLVKSRSDEQQTHGTAYVNMAHGGTNATKFNVGSRSVGFGGETAYDIDMVDCNANEESVSQELHLHGVVLRSHTQNDCQPQLSSSVQLQPRPSQSHIADVSRSLQSFRFLAKQGLMHRSSLRSVQELNMYQQNFATRQIQLEMITDAV
eukprot:CAMPEP_0202699550 /NCGR_PEP_ID=MMETSP1385-20130828/12784_1 /ASSEMBLY_ACC=CAM_ASM_000861 /TAXON_ID=933848 /ORGANISM="Elphidium margaritaceum" /LENGTH=749 /DNA_ID=CAMNT_0049356525 /DNA_START=136 /DNA_END=2385 /DNA_ORIENTATION=-